MLLPQRFHGFGKCPEQGGQRHDNEAWGSGEHRGKHQSGPDGHQSQHAGNHHGLERRAGQNIGGGRRRDYQSENQQCV